ncbi:MAG: SMC-Scp complex subunit ScpB [Endomicrobia bacterium]|nr:SMC-Scp complex subunit ScpB [Endomicrobiia bacterium]
MDKNLLKDVVETLLFITDKPLSKKKIAELIDDPEINESIVEEIISELTTQYLKNSAIEIRNVAEGYQMATKSKYSEYVRRLYRDRTLLRLSPAAVETLAIIAYRQPITKAEIEETRGVDCTGVIETLLERKLIKIVGRKEIIGRPLLYATTTEFLKYFGLSSLSDLPPIEDFIEENIETEQTTLENHIPSQKEQIKQNVENSIGSDIAHQQTKEDNS